LRIIFAGTPRNAARSLKLLVDAGFIVVGVLTRADAARGRHKTLQPSEVAQLANELQIPTFKTNRIDQAARDWLSGLEADLGVIVAYGAILETDTLKIPKHGWINLHYSLLPELPGAAPVQHAIIRGLMTTGVSVFRLDEGLDTGSILAQRSAPIAPNCSAGELLESLTDLGGELLIEVLQSMPEIFEVAWKQNLPADRKIAFKPSREFAKLDFNSSSRVLHNLVRGLNPEPMAWFYYLDTPVRVLQARTNEDRQLAVGRARLLDGAVCVGCGIGTLELLQVQPAGKRAMPAADWFRGLRAEEIQLT
jgi:methionyl-tRNA formyltransferase